MFKCDIDSCGKSFTNKHSLKRHKVTHDPNKKYKCDECSKSFSLPQYLKEHKIVHSGERPFVWNFPGCGKSFRQAGKLSIHKKEHNMKSKQIYNYGSAYSYPNQNTLWNIDFSNAWLMKNLSQTCNLLNLYCLCDLQTENIPNYSHSQQNFYGVNDLSQQLHTSSLIGDQLFTHIPDINDISYNARFAELNHYNL